MPADRPSPLDLLRVVPILGWILCLKQLTTQKTVPEHYNKTSIQDEVFDLFVHVEDY